MPEAKVRPSWEAASSPTPIQLAALATFVVGQRLQRPAQCRGGLPPPRGPPPFSYDLQPALNQLNRQDLLRSILAAGKFSDSVFRGADQPAAIAGWKWPPGRTPASNSVASTILLPTPPAPLTANRAAAWPRKLARPLPSAIQLTRSERAHPQRGTGATTKTSVRAGPGAANGFSVTRATTCGQRQPRQSQ